jgi:hypothetical protein
MAAAVSRKRKQSAQQGDVDQFPDDLLRHEQYGASLAPLAEAWPARSLIFKVWGADIGDRDAMIRNVLLSRGWKDGGNPCNPEDVNELPTELSRNLPRRALYIVGEDGFEPREYLKVFSPLGPNKFRFTMFPGSEVACYKSATAKMLRNHLFHPQTFVLPAERQDLLDAHAAALLRGEPAYWVGKPKNSYAGRGLTVASDPLALIGDESRVKSFGDPKKKKSQTDRNQTPNIVQRYVSNPLLIGGFKSHIRVYMLVTAIEPEVITCSLSFILVWFSDILGDS